MKSFINIRPSHNYFMYSISSLCFILLLCLGAFPVSYPQDKDFYENHQLGFRVPLKINWSVEEPKSFNEPYTLTIAAQTTVGRRETEIFFTVTRNLETAQRPKDIVNFEDMIFRLLTASFSGLERTARKIITSESERWIILQQFDALESKLLCVSGLIHNDMIHINYIKDAQIEKSDQQFALDFFNSIELLPLSSNRPKQAKYDEKTINEIEAYIPTLLSTMIRAKGYDVHFDPPGAAISVNRDAVDIQIKIPFIDYDARSMLDEFCKFVTAFSRGEELADPTGINTNRLMAYAGAIPMMFTGIVSYLKTQNVMVNDIVLICQDRRGITRARFQLSGRAIYDAMRINTDQAYVDLIKRINCRR